MDFIFLSTSSMLSPRPSSNRPITTKSPTDQRTSAVNCIATKGSVNKDNKIKGVFNIFTEIAQQY